MAGSEAEIAVVLAGRPRLRDRGSQYRNRQTNKFQVKTNQV
jgi:hypothetical protein